MLCIVIYFLPWLLEKPHRVGIVNPIPQMRKLTVEVKLKADICSLELEFRTKPGPRLLKPCCLLVDYRFLLGQNRKHNNPFLGTHPSFLESRELCKSRRFIHVETDDHLFVSGR